MNDSNVTAGRYRISAHLLCHDIRLNTWLELTVDRNCAPSEKEAMDLLHPLAKAKVDPEGGPDCPYELSDVRVAPLS